MCLPLNQQYIKIDLKNLQEPNWAQVTEKQKLEVYKFRINVKEDDVNKYRKVLPIIRYLAGNYRYAVFKKIRCNSCKNLISRRNIVEEIPKTKVFSGD